jgi:hypothetical protein
MEYMARTYEQEHVQVFQAWLKNTLLVMLDEINSPNQETKVERDPPNNTDTAESNSMAHRRDRS